MAAKMFPFWYLNPPPPYVCPSGEQLINGDFSDGFSSWYNEWSDPMYAVWISVGGHTNGCATNNLWMDTYWGYWLSQDIDNLPAECVQSCSCWYYQYVYANRAKLRLTYTDDTYTEVQGSTVGSWAQMSITATAGKVIKKISVRCTGGHTKMDDVSLISSGLPI